ncbi:MAG: hypothetical protein JNN12_13415 [Bacteroidetes Order II. Incertae sedis bacterium]|nr:hypothetical protein [Bacteroidetes Order II. bacterium]
MPRCAFLSIEDLSKYVCDDELVIKYLQENGWDIETIPWRKKEVDWLAFDLVVVRSTWDYQSAPKAFFEALQQIKKTGVPLLNSLALVAWNLEKTYLRDIEKAGFDIVPTLWSKSPLQKAQLLQAFSTFSTAELILKPIVSANADHTYRLVPEDVNSLWPVLAEAYRSRPFMIQPFISQIITEGEFSLFFFGGEYSHSMLKRPRSGDFRVQEEHGGHISACDPPPELLQESICLVSQLPDIPFQARVDWVRQSPEKNQFMVMELELIEPSLYFRFAPHAVVNFKTALERHLTQTRL